NLVYNQAYRIMGEQASAEDAVQEAFISAYKKLHTYRGGSFKSWLLRIVSNACYDEFRRRKRQPVAPLYPEDQDGNDLDTASWLEGNEEKPEDYVLRSELSAAIQTCLDRLDFEFRTIVVLVDLQGMDYASAANVVDCPLGTVKSRLARARRNLKDCLQSFRELLPVEFRHVGEA
ncbi:MAG: sigma-70 family RNA polymerase sigma factor, partial [Anaerolineales bacterium]|nr:sigma-70 family RNA polymerase sigma factor [Anaerolineales bacterium]